MRCYLTLCAMGLAFGCLVGLVIANRLLLAADGLYGPARSTREEERRKALKAEEAWLIRGTAEKGYVFERDWGEVMWSVN